jgi:signal peptidase II
LACSPAKCRDALGADRAGAGDFRLGLAVVAARGARRWAQVSAGLLIGGALGNVVDRIVYGAVADFLNMSCCGIANPFAFNVADITIFAGAIGLVLFSGGEPHAEGRKTP